MATWVITSCFGLVIILFECMFRMSKTHSWFTSTGFTENCTHSFVAASISTFRVKLSQRVRRLNRTNDFQRHRICLGDLNETRLFL